MGGIVDSSENKPDRLGYDVYAKALAEQAFKMETQNPNIPFCVGLHGLWGSGKTSLWNLVKDRFQDQAKTVELRRKRANNEIDYDEEELNSMEVESDDEIKESTTSSILLQSFAPVCAVSKRIVSLYITNRKTKSNYESVPENKSKNHSSNAAQRREQEEHGKVTVVVLLSFLFWLPLWPLYFLFRIFRVLFSPHVWKDLGPSFVGDDLTKEDNENWFGGVLGNDGFVYGVPYCANKILKFNPRSESTSLVCDNLLSSARRKWCSGVVWKDKIFLSQPTTIKSFATIPRTKQQLKLAMIWQMRDGNGLVKCLAQMDLFIVCLANPQRY